MSKEQQAQFHQASMRKTHEMEPVPKHLYEVLAYMESVIRQEIKSSNIMILCGSNSRKYMIDQELKEAFSALFLKEKISYYCSAVDYIILEQKKPTFEKDSPADFDWKINSKLFIFKSFNTWDLQPVVLSAFKLFIGSKYTLDLRNYIIRTSKKKERECYAL